MLSFSGLPQQAECHKNYSYCTKPQNIQYFSFCLQNRQSQKSIAPKKKESKMRSHTLYSKVERCNTEGSKAAPLQERRSLKRIKTDFMSVAWQLQKPLIAQIRGIDFSKQEKLKLLNKKSNFKDYSAILKQRKRLQSKEIPPTNKKSSFLKQELQKNLNLTLRQISVSKQEERKHRKKYKLLNLIGNKLPLHRIDERIFFHDSPMFLRSNTDDCFI